MPIEMTDKKKKIVIGGKFIALGHGEMLQLMNEIAKRLNAESKIITTKRKTKNGENFTVSSLTGEGVKKVAQHFGKMIKGSKKPFLVGGTKIIYGIDSETDDMVEQYIFGALAKECLDFVPNATTSRVAHEKVA